jgi:hypothetical protein
MDEVKLFGGKQVAVRAKVHTVGRCFQRAPAGQKALLNLVRARWRGG